jgi:hypothetical protein
MAVGYRELASAGGVDAWRMLARRTKNWQRPARRRELGEWKRLGINETKNEKE